MKTRITSIILAACLVASLVRLFFVENKLILMSDYLSQYGTQIYNSSHAPGAIVRTVLIDDIESDVTFEDMANLIRSINRMGFDMDIDGFYYRSPCLRAEGMFNDVPFLPCSVTGDSTIPELVLTCLGSDHECAYDDNVYYKRNHPIHYASEDIMDWVNEVEQGSHVSIWADANTSFRSLVSITTLLGTNGMEVAWGEPQANSNNQEHVKMRIRVDATSNSDAPWVILRKM